MGSGEPTENEIAARDAIDGDPLTSWRTEDYATRSFGNLKPGVGLIIDLSGPHRIGHISIASPTAGWAVQIHATDGPAPDSVTGWGASVASATNIGGSIDLSMHEVSASSVLLWITDLGEGIPAHVEITEVGFSSD